MQPVTLSGQRWGTEFCIFNRLQGDSGWPRDPTRMDGRAQGSEVCHWTWSRTTGVLSLFLLHAFQQKQLSLLIQKYHMRICLQMYSTALKKEEREEGRKQATALKKIYASMKTSNSAGAWKELPTNNAAMHWCSLQVGLGHWPSPNV